MVQIQIAGCEASLRGVARNEAKQSVASCGLRVAGCEASLRGVARNEAKQSVASCGLHLSQPND